MTLERDDAVPMDVPLFFGYQKIAQALQQGDMAMLRKAIVDAGLSQVDPAYSFAQGASAIDILVPTARRLLILTRFAALDSMIARSSKRRLSPHSASRSLRSTTRWGRIRTGSWRTRCLLKFAQW